jgi:hypothetical protein
MIPTWTERCKKFGDEIVTNAKIQQAMQEEIDELREALALRELTSDEIMEICDEVGRDYKRWGYFQVEFARAILRKAQEK